MDTSKVVVYLKAQNDDLERELGVQADAIQQAQRRVELLEKRARFAGYARELAQRIDSLEQGKAGAIVKSRRGYWEILGL